MGLTASSCIRLKISQLHPKRIKKKKKKKKDMYYGYLALGCLVFIQVHILMHYELNKSEWNWHEGDSFEIQNM